MDGLEEFREHLGGELTVMMLEAIGTGEALALRGTAAVAQAKLAYERFTEVFSGPRWEALAAEGASGQATVRGAELFGGIYERRTLGAGHVMGSYDLFFSARTQSLRAVTDVKKGKIWY